jgi:beta-lactamase superfamily II metal-dependent hydrolase
MAASLRVATLGVAVLLALAVAAHADVVVPADSVTTRVVVRASASAHSESIGSLHPGEQLALIGSVPYWHEVRLASGASGYVSKRWTRVIPSGAPPGHASGPRFTIDVIDVGTGLAVLVRGAAFTLLYDGGSNDDLARGVDNRLLAYVRAVAPTLTTIDHVILSHPHRDHVELLPDLFAAYQINEVWDSGRVHDICGYRAFLTAVSDEPGVLYHNALQDFGMRDYAFGAKTCYGESLPPALLPLLHASRITTAFVPLGEDASLTFLHADGGPHASPNENSLVARLDLGGTRVLLMGDAEAGGRESPSMAPSPSSIEGTLLACCPSDVAADLLVVGHHGSRTSSRGAFLDAVGASVFIVSSGPTRYGSVVLPDEDVIHELAARGTVFRTDVDDARCATNGAKIGPDGDGRPGGCDHVRVAISPADGADTSYWRGADAP